MKKLTVKEVLEEYGDSFTMEEFLALEEQQAIAAVTREMIEDIKEREQKGLNTYKQTMDRKDMTQLDWLQHLYEELLDAALYTKKIMNSAK